MVKKFGNVQDKPPRKLLGTVEKVIPAVVPNEPEKQISGEGADELYKEIRLENTLQDESGKPVKWKEGAAVEITIEAEPQATTPVSRSGAEETAPSNCR